MPTPQAPGPPLRIRLDWRGRWQKKVAPLVEGTLERFLQLHQVNEVYRESLARTGPRPFYDKALDVLQIQYQASPEDRARIPAAGPVVVVANHPFGAVEGLILASVLRAVRPDVRFLANYLLGEIPELSDLFFFVDPFGARTATRANLRPLRQAIQWLEQEHMLVVFPAGEVAHLDVRRRAVLDPPWNDAAARIVRRTRASVLPVFFKGANGPVFQVLGLVHPRLRTAMLAHELLNKREKRLEVRIGTALPFARLDRFPTDPELTAYLRQRTYLLKHRRGRRRKLAMLPLAWPKPSPAVAPQVPRDVLREEIARLPESHRLAEQNGFQVWVASAGEVPSVLLELGRLREITFRAVGEGSRRALDLDRFDRDYLHLWLWNEAEGEIVGAYRMGQTDLLLPNRGPRALYTSTIYDFHPRFLASVFPALEMGRSFIRPEYQRSPQALPLLWKGIGKFLVQNPRYRYLFGTVSISSEYLGYSRQLMVESLRLRQRQEPLARWVKPWIPFRPNPFRAAQTRADCNWVSDADELSSWVAEVEDDRKGIPVLLRHYLRLNGRILGFNLDPSFGHCVDGLILVDLTETDRHILHRYMGRDGAEFFLSFHRSAQAVPA